MDTLSIFISSAIGEFANERQALKAALERWQFVRAWAFEEETAYSEQLEPGYLRRVAESDIVVLLIGDTPSDPVEKEFVTALNAQRPILAFVKRSAQERANALFAKHQASDKFKYALFDDAPQLEALVVAALSDEILYRFWLTRDQTRQLVQVLPHLSQAERDELDHAYLAEVVCKYEFWRTHYTPLAAIARRSDLRGLGDLEGLNAATPAEFLPRGFDVLLCERFPHERKEQRELKTEHYDDLRDAIKKHGDLILLGDPGAGKTTTLWRLMFDYATRASGVIASGAKQSPTRESGIASSQKSLLAMTQRLPVLISLGRYDGTSSILDFLRAELVLQSKADSSGNAYPAHRKLAAHLDQYLDDGRLMLLFDALNEMPQAHYSDSIRRLEQFRDAQPGNRFIFTCRALDYTTKLELPEATIQELDEDAQRDFLTAYFADAGARLFERLRDSHRDLLEIGRNPYMLLMIGQVYQLQGELPPNRGLLFQSFVNALMERERKTHPDRWLDAEIQIHALSDLAFAIQREHGRGTSVPCEWADKYLTGSVRVNGRDVAYNPADMLYLARSASLLDESADGSLRFTHQLLQEYFAAVALLRLGVNDPQVRDAARYYSWDEVLVLLAGLMDDATPLVELVMAVDPYLAARCVGGARVASTTVCDALIERLAEKLYSPIEIESGMALLAIHVSKSEKAIPCVLPLLASEDSDMVRSAVEILKELKSETVIPHLVPLLASRSTDVRWAAVEVLSVLSPESVLPEVVSLLKSDDSDVRFVTVRLLGNLKSELAIPYLLPLLEDTDASIREASADVLGKLEATSAIPNLIPLLEDREPRVAWVAACALVDLQSSAAIDYLLTRLDSRDPDDRIAVVTVLGKLETEEVIPYLIERLEDCGEAAAEALKKFKPRKVIPLIVANIQNKNWSFRHYAAQLLGEFKTEEAIPCLISLIEDEDGHISNAAQEALGKLYCSRALTAVLV